MTEKITINELGELIKGFRKYINNPKHSNEAGEILQLLKKVNKELDKYDRTRRRNRNRRI